MNADPSLEQALVEFTRLIVPLTTEIGAPAAASSAGNLTAALKPFAFLLGLNFLTFTLSYYLGKIALRVLESVVNIFAFGLTLGSLFMRRHITRNLRKRLRSHRCHTKATRKTRIIEDDASFKSWEQISNGTVYWCFGGELTNEIRHALNILGVHAFSTESDIRKAYLTLMKKYHPDHFMQAPPLDIERAQLATIQIREAYDKITSEFCRAQ
jgi:hypothetical protein